MATQPSAGQALRENICLLRMLVREPHVPRENSLPRPRKEETRQLTIEREFELVDTLAFVTASSGQPDKVLAVCVEERSDEVTFRVAVNTGSITTFRENLSRVARVMQEAARRVVTVKAAEEALTSEIIETNRLRILSRLRSSHALRSQKTWGKKPVIQHLEKVLQELLRQEPENDHLSDLAAGGAHLTHLFERLETESKGKVRSGRKDALLLEISRTAHQIAAHDDLASLSGRIQNLGAFGPETGPSLQRALSKLGRYSSAAGFLIRVARRLLIFKNIRVEGRSSSVWLTPLRSVADPDTSLAPVLGRILSPGTARKRTKLNNRLAAFLKQPIGRIESTFSSRLQQTCTIHAEIQLLLHYEVHPVEILPRTISSSKSACFLCNLLVNLHGTFCVQRTHGVLYDQWTLPDWTDNEKLAKTIVQINDALEQHIRSKLQQQRIQPFTHPNESICLEPALWTPSVRSSVQNIDPAAAEPSPAVEIPPASFDEIDRAPKGGSPSNVLMGSSSLGFMAAPLISISEVPQNDTSIYDQRISASQSTSSVATSNVPPETASSNPSGGTLPKTGPGSDPEPSINQSNESGAETTSTSAAAGRSDDLVLIQGESTWIKLTPFAPSVGVKTRHVTLHLSFEPEPPLRPDDMKLTSTQTKEHCEMRVQWLKDDDELAPRHIFDLVSLQENHDHTLSCAEQRQLYVRHHSDVVAINYM
ncbi:MAG: hypothetical protein M1823_002912 [Watsoniomyces obsoletus]|nr:MAG: hypothetical protein M1823_002912 [Watsoniomyces obsoletus]